MTAIRIAALTAVLTKTPQELLRTLKTSLIKGDIKMFQAMEQVRDYIALIMTVAVLAMVGFKIPVPDRIWDIYMMVIAFFFGSKNGQTNGGSNASIQSDSPVVQKPIQQPAGQGV
jgi:hypothetical protein